MIDQDVTALGPRLTAAVLAPMKRAFIGKDEVIDLLGVALAAGENLFLLGPPGTAKSALVRDLGRRLGGASFEYLLTRFTEPSELFGPFDIRRLREGELVTNTEGMLPEASFVFLDELLNANSAILNGLLTVLNERVFRRGRETRPLPALLFVAASNRLPDDEALLALFDRFLLRVRCDNVAEERLAEVLDAGRRLEVSEGEAPPGAGLKPAPTSNAQTSAPPTQGTPPTSNAQTPAPARVNAQSYAPPLVAERSPPFGVEDARRLQRALPGVDLAAVRPSFVDLVGRLRAAGIPISDRRAVKLERAVAASALVMGRARALPTDLWVVRHTWDQEESREVVRAQVDRALGRALEEAGAEDGPAHPRSRAEDDPDPDALAREVDAIEARLRAEGIPSRERSALRDRAGLLASRAGWVRAEPARDALQKRLERILST